jgi:hypothetical protein
MTASTKYFQHPERTAMTPRDDDNDTCSVHSNSTTEMMTPPQRDRSIEDICRVRDEADALRNEICTLRTRLEEVEDERNFHAAKAHELTDIVKTKKDDAYDELEKKAKLVAEMSTRLERLEMEKQAIANENRKLHKQLDVTRSEMGDLSVVVRSLQTAAYFTDDDNDTVSDDEDEVVLTPEKALDMTLVNMKAHIEALEDALQQSSVLNKSQKKKIDFLENENKLKEIQIEMLEELFREFNQVRSDDSIKNNGDCVGTDTKTARMQRNIRKSLSASSLNIEGGIRTVYGATERIASSVSSSISDTLSSGVELRQAEKATSASRSAGIRTKIERGRMNKIKICFKKAGLEGMYTGPLVNGLPHGVGTIRFTNGDTYLGEMTHGKMSGKGTLYTKSKGIFRGCFENNKFVGDTK